MSGIHSGQLDHRSLAGEARAGSLVIAIELIGVFAIAVALMTFLYAGTGGASGDERGLPGYDDFYHAKMSVLMPKIGLIDKFPWLTTTIFADHFVNHHWAFQALMAPFIYAGHWLTGDWAAGARWAITCFFGVVMVLFDVLLITERVRFRWLWMGLFLVMPTQFFGRHVFIRAISLSLACMLGILILMFRRRYVWCALLIALYVHIYLGALCYVPVLVGAYWFSGLVGDDPRDRVSWKLLVWAGAGLALGWISHPYRDGVFDFLRVQVFGSGLTPDIAVGREWKSYEGKLWEVVFEYFGSTLSLLVIAIVARLRLGGRLNARETAVLLINFGFLVLTLRQRRFIEYWPPFGLLASAMVLSPVLSRLRRGAAAESPAVPGAAGPAAANPAPVPNGNDLDVVPEQPVPLQSAVTPVLLLILAILAWTGVVLLLRVRGPALELAPLLAEWPVWAWVIFLCALGPFLKFWGGTAPHDAPASAVADSRRRRRSLVLGIVNLISGLGLTALAVLPLVLVLKPPAGRLNLIVPLALWAVVGIAYVLLARAVASPLDDAPRARLVSAISAAAGAFGGAAYVIMIFLAAGPQMVALQRSSRCSFDLPAIRATMDYLKSISAENSIIFTDDWDIFPVFFYHNHHNRYIVGLDPMFSHAHDPLLYARYVKITQSKKFPAKATVEVEKPDGSFATLSDEVKLEDIRDHFHAEYVIVDPDHRQIGRNLEAAPELAERIYPPGQRERDKWPPFTIYRIKPAVGE